MKKSPHRHRSRRDLRQRRRSSWNGSVAAWKIEHLAAVARIQAMPPGSNRSMAAAMMETKAVYSMRVLAGLDGPMFEMPDAFLEPGMLPFGAALEITSNSAWQWTADGGFKEIV